MGMSTVPLKTPRAVGWNVTFTVHDVEWNDVVVGMCLLSQAAPVTGNAELVDVTVEIFTWAPVSEMVIVWAALVEPSPTEPNVRDEGETEIPLLP
jgi:hypothetical protein